jgi:signal peptidase I
VDPSRPPRTALAVLLACLCPGLGQIYLGRTVRGFVLLILGLGFLPVAVAVASSGPTPLSLAVLLVTAGLAVLALVAGLIDAAIPRAEDGLRPPPTRTALYVGVLVLALVGLGFGVGGAFWLRANLLEAFRIPTGSMAPAILEGDRVLVAKRTSWDRPLRRGDLIVYRAPGEGGRAFIKRVVALPGEIVQLEGEAVLVNGTPLADLNGDGRDLTGVERYPGGGEVDVTVPSGASPGDRIPVPPGHCYVLGDHRADSRDSRQHGPVPLDAIVGVVEYRYWPPSRLGLVR